MKSLLLAYFLCSCLVTCATLSVYEMLSLWWGRMACGVSEYCWSCGMLKERCVLWNEVALGGILVIDHRPIPCINSKEGSGGL